MQTRTYNNMNYRELQKDNKSKLSKELDKHRKKLNLKNRGWKAVIRLYEWIQEKVQGHSIQSTTELSELKLELKRNCSQIVRSSERMDDLIEEEKQACDEIDSILQKGKTAHPSITEDFIAAHTSIVLGCDPNNN